MAMKMGCLKKGGVPDIHKAAQRVLSDWMNGKLTYFTEPPERTNEIISTELVTQMKEAFDIDALLNNEDEQLNDLHSYEEENMSESENSNVEAMEEDHQPSTTTSNEVFDYKHFFFFSLLNISKVHFTVQAMDRTKRLSKQRTADLADKQQDDEIRRSIKSSNLIRQQEFKKMKKNQKRTGKFYIFFFFVCIEFSLIRKINGKSGQCTRYHYSIDTYIDCSRF
jgi:hypothetical protein